MGGMGDFQIKVLNGDAYECVLCNGYFEGYGNNPEPCADAGRCCDNCNSTKVIPQRMNDTIFLERRKQERQSFIHILRQLSHDWFINNS